MEMKEYLVTCKSYKDLQSLYNDMETEGGTLYIPNRAVELLDRREISRNTHYKLTAEEAELISNDKRVKHITLHPDEIEGLEVGLDGFTNFESYTVTGDFTKASSTDTGPYEDDYPWSLLHSAGTVAQRRQYSWGDSPGTERVNDSVDIYSNGKHVDVVIIDGAVGKNFAEWKSDTTGQSRFVEYDWYGEHPEIYSGTYNHPDASGSHDHGNHVCGTVAGRYYGWAREANIYALTFNGSHGTTRIFDLVRAFHKKKPINPVTGRKNPTITNSSWGFRSTSFWNSSSIDSINYRGTTYTPSNPGPSGWTAAGLEADFGLAYSGNFPTRYDPLDADLEDALVEGIVIIAAAGNSNHYQVREGHPDFNNTLDSSSVFGSNFPMHKGASPGAVPGVICVGAQNSTTDNTRATYTNYGDRIDVFAPGTRTLSVAGRGTYPSSLKGAITRSEYSGIDKLMTIQGTSMASPQVCGIIACAATGRGRFDQDDAIGLIRGLSRDDVIAFDTEVNGNTYQSILDDSSSTSNGYVWFTSNARNVSGNTNANGLFVNPTFRIHYYDTIKLYTKTNSTYTADISAAGTGSGYTISGTHRQGNFSGNNPTIHLEQYDHIKFEASTSFSSHPLYIRDSNGNNVTNNGTQTGIDQSGDTYTFIANLSPGTYIYQCAAHPGMQGDIIVHTRGALTSHPLFIRDSNGNNVAEVINNGFSSGHIEWTPGWSAGENVEYVDYTYQCGNHPTMQGTIRVENPWFNTKVGKPGGYDDIRCQQGSPNREIFCNNPRPTTGYISGFKQSTLNGRRRTDREDNNTNQNRQLYPRVNGFYQQ